MVNPVYIETPVLGKDIKLVVPGARAQEIQKALETRTKILGRVRSYEFKGATDLRQNNRSKFTPPIYDLSEIARAADVEPYITQSVRKHREQILKEGYQITGIDEEMVAYVRRRLFEIAVVTGITTEQWLRELVTNLIIFHNSFLIFRRDAKRSSGKPIIMYGKELEPIAGIFVGDPTSMEVAVDKWGSIKKWRQHIEGLAEFDTNVDKSYNTEDVVHVTIDKKTGFTFGTPFLLPVLDDIRALRKLEEVAIIMASKEAFPLYHYKIGTETRPSIVYEGGGNEIDEVTAKVSDLPAQGFIVTSERHEVNLISKNGATLDLSPYLAYFESRVVAGLRLSPLDLGRGSSVSRGTATNLNKGLQDSAKDYQQVLSDHITHFVILPLLLEGNFDVTEENIVKFNFPTIDREEERASQNHGAQLYMGNSITLSEFRKQYLNKQPMTEEEKNDCQLRADVEAQKEIARAQGAARASASGGSDLSSGIKNTLSNRGQPSNQYGTKPAKSRFKANDLSDKVIDRYTVTKSLILTSIEDQNVDAVSVEQYFREFVKTAIDLSKPEIEQVVNIGYSKAKKEFDTLHPDEDVDFEEIGTRALDRFYNNFLVKSYWKIITPYKDQLISIIKRDVRGNIDAKAMLLTLSSLEDAIKILIRDQIITSERFGFIKFAKKVGSKTIDLVNPDTEDRYPLDISEMVYKNFIPTNENFDYFLSFSTNKNQNCE